MRKMLNKDNKKLIGHVENLTGDTSKIWGEVREDLCGNASNISGCVSAISGCVSAIYGCVGGIRGRVDGIWGCVDEIEGNLDDCEITDKERAVGVNIHDLIGGERNEEDAK